MTITKKKRADEARIRNAREQAELLAKYSHIDAEDKARDAKRRVRSRRPHTHFTLGARAKNAAKSFLQRAKEMGEFDREVSEVPRRAQTPWQPVIPGIDTKPRRPYTGAPLRVFKVRETPAANVVALPRPGSVTGPGARVIASSFERYNGGARVKRQYGSSTVTRFYVYYERDKDDSSKWKIVEGYGKTPGERKTDAIEKSGLRKIV